MSPQPAHAMHCHFCARPVSEFVRRQWRRLPVRRRARRRNVRQKAGLNREVLDVAFGETRRQIAYKAVWHARDIVVVARFDPTSKTCSACGAVNADLALGDRRWTCAGCATAHDREENAAVNIRGYAQPGHRGEHGVCAALAR